MADFAMKINLMADSSATRVPVMPGGSMVCRLNQRGCQSMNPNNISMLIWQMLYSFLTKIQNSINKKNYTTSNFLSVISQERF